MENVFPILIVAIAVVLGAIIFWLPPTIAKNRWVSESNRKTVQLLTILGVFFGLTWIVALVLACVYPADDFPRNAVKLRAARSDTGYRDPIPDSFQATHRAHERALPPGDTELCANCGRQIGRLETPSVWKENIVYGACHKLLLNG